MRSSVLNKVKVRWQQNSLKAICNWSSGERLDGSIDLVIVHGQVRSTCYNEKGIDPGVKEVAYDAYCLHYLKQIL